MSDNDRRRGEQAAREFAETENAFDQVREAMAARLLSSPPEASAERERLYLAVQVLDAVRAKMTALIATAADSKVIEVYAASVREGRAAV
jgi:hypothetical protein